MDESFLESMPSLAPGVAAQGFEAPPRVDALEEPVSTALPRGTKTGELDQVEAETDNCFRIGIH